MAAKNKEVKLYDLKERDYPNYRGAIFRSRQIAECDICGALTNEVVMGGWPGYGVRTICPNAGEEWHHKLESKIRWLKLPHPKKYKRELEKEIKKMKEKCEDKVKNDLARDVDIENKALRVSVTNTWAEDWAGKN